MKEPTPIKLGAAVFALAVMAASQPLVVFIPFAVGMGFGALCAMRWNPPLTTG